MSAATTRSRALFAHVTTPPPAAPLVERSRTGRELPPVLIDGAWLSREEVGAALFESCADQDTTSGLDTDTLRGLVAATVRELAPLGLLETTEVFASLDAVEFPEVGYCRWFAYRLCLSGWYERARSRPMTAGEAAAALYLSDYDRHPGTPSDPRALARAVRQGAGCVPVTALVRLGRAVVAEHARVNHPHADAGRWLHAQLLPDERRRRACFHLIRTRPRIPLPLIVRTDVGTHHIGRTPPPGPGNQWARPLREEW
ncbi:hypothetical protein [Streptomyces buecherae]|uniref:hypothetical protein n=1 Tax=Streptomyces buecherae TaxID=2763006 RepID=UPI001E2A8DCA|nr:hypothetical protein [Streptomyces buecherae]